MCETLSEFRANGNNTVVVQFSIEETNVVDYTKCAIKTGKYANMTSFNVLNTFANVCK